MGVGAKWSKAIGLVLCLACSEEQTRPPNVENCNDPPCVDVRTGIPMMAIGSVQPAPGGGQAGAGGDAGTEPVTALQGSVRMISDADLSGSDPPNVPVEIRATGAGTSVVIGAPSADGSFSMDGVLAQEQTWLAVGNFEALGSPFLDTYQVVSSAAGLPVELAVMQRTVMADIAQLSFSLSAQDLAPDRGHAILQFVDELGVPVSGVSVTFPTSNDAEIAYDMGDVYSDGLTETSLRGTVVLLNLVAAPYPGGLTTVVANVADVPDSEVRPQLRVSAGAVTLYTVPIDLTP